ncbi:MAG TPA: asparagine synthase (glutamine-hydrolyzing) [Candidatus Limnocylindrales bacterium]|nr:asparagine synthase (glutamine-hydrolyzing) [Candidatus Limnocylindrales bacterium]
MCGITGMADARLGVDRDLLERMNETLRHRGPDSGGVIVSGAVGLAARRLSIIDLEGGDQPVSNEDGSCWVVQNGEIYNHAELRVGLEADGHRFRSRGDTEVLVHLYERDGPTFPRRLRGMFAVAVWDEPRGRLVLARDPFGIKPLYYRVSGGRLTWASEPKALLRDPDVSREIDVDALEAYLALNAVPGHLSIYRDIRKLPAGHVLIWDRDAADAESSIRIERCALRSPVAADQLRDEDEATLAEELRTRLRDSVRAHLIADVPVGVMLSGGLDSAAITAFAADILDQPVRTFSIGFDERSFDELENARLVATRYGTDHHELVVRPDAAELLPILAKTFDEPFADSSALPTYLVSRLAAGHVKVALSGEGGDELFGGYYTYVADQLAPALSGVARLARPFVERLPASTDKVSFDYKAKRFVRSAGLPPLERHVGWKEIFSADARAELVADHRGADPLDLYRARFAGTAGATPLARLQDVDLGIYLVDDLLVKVDRASMARSLEARVPFLDPVVAELALALPDRYKVRGLSTKRLLRHALRPLLPREVVDGKKHGFSIPLAAWLRGPLLPLAREMLSPATLRSQGFFAPKPVARLIDDHAAGRVDQSRLLWNLLMFGLWFDAYGRPESRVQPGQNHGLDAEPMVRAS